MWFQTSAVAATRQFQLTRLFAELVAASDIEREVRKRPHSPPRPRDGLPIAPSAPISRAPSSSPTRRFSPTPKQCSYDIEALQQAYIASFEQVAHRLVTLRKPGESGVPFGFLRSDPAGRLTKHFPMPGLPLPSAGHACPLWAIYDAFRTPGTRRAPARAISRRLALSVHCPGPVAPAGAASPTVPSTPRSCSPATCCRPIAPSMAPASSSADPSLDVPVGPSCRLCPRRDCAERQEEALSPGGRPVADPGTFGGPRISMLAKPSECALTVGRLLEGGREGGTWRSTY